MGTLGENLMMKGRGAKELVKQERNERKSNAMRNLKAAFKGSYNMK